MKKAFWMTAFFLLTSSLLVLPALADGAAGGSTDVVQTTAAVNETSPLSPFVTVTQPGDYVAAGIGMRATGSGIIDIVGIPNGAVVTHAFLYWAILGQTLESNYASGFFNSHEIIGTPIGTGSDPCWPNATTTFAFRADVTSLVQGNGVYELSGFASGADFVTAPMNEGASLVIVYNDPTAAQSRNVTIYEGVAVIDESTTSVSAELIVPAINPLGGVSTTYIVADGQDIFSDTTFFNGVTLAADSSSSGDMTSFEGSDGAVWDTDSYDVTGLVSADDTSISVEIQRGTDCLIHIAQILSADVLDAQLVDIDIVPNVDGNLILCQETADVPVAILTTDDFDALDVDHTTVTFAGASERHTVSGEPVRHETDVDRDGDVDLLFHFRLGDTNLSCGAQKGTLGGETFGGQKIIRTGELILRGATR